MCKALPNWAVLVREDFATAECMCVLPSYKHAVVWFCFCKLRVNCSQRCVYKYTVCACSVRARMSVALGNGRDRKSWEVSMALSFM